MQIYHVWIDVLDQRRPQIAFFSTRDIAPGEELTFDYKYEIKEKRLRCHCGAKNCKKWLL
jgi:SET domain-containing protein